MCYEVALRARGNVQCGGLAEARYVDEVDRYERSCAMFLALRRKGGGTLPRDFIRFSRCLSV